MLVAGGGEAGLTHVTHPLSNDGYELTVAGDGLEALRALQSESPPPLAVLDWAMPGLGGIDVRRKLRHAERRRSTYIILLTRWGQRNDQVAALEAGANDCVYKPVDWRELGKATGQGLALPHSAVVNRHQDEIWFASEVGRGTTFFVRLPLDVGYPVS